MRWSVISTAGLLIFVICLAAPARAQGGRPDSDPREFEFPKDALSYVNELAWEYELDESQGKMIEHRRVPKPAYTLHCFAVARAVRQFYYHARFDPSEPPATRAGHRQFIHLIMSRRSDRPSPEAEKIVIPGFSDLHQFSAENEDLLKAETGGSWRSFVQRGNWRVVFPFRRSMQEKSAEDLARALGQGRLPIVHLLDFPKLNHALLLYDVRVSGEEFEFSAYDPNEAGHPVRLRFLRSTRQFTLGRTPYFAGGPINVYETYRGWCY